MRNMKKSKLGRQIMVLGGLFLSASLAQASPVTLSDNALDGVTAGTANQASSAGGVIVGNSSSADIVKNGVVTIDGAQESARAVNMVTSTDSLVGNGFNLLSGQSEQVGFSKLINNEQNNNILQDQLQSARVPDYVRSEANVNKTTSEVSTMSNVGEVVTIQKVFGQEIKAGKGVSIAGSLEGKLTGGNITFDNELHTSANINGGFDILGDVFNATADATITLDTKQKLDWTLPDLDLNLKAAGCWVVMGTCKADGSFDTTLGTTENTRSPFSLKNAEAEYIVVDESQLNVTSTYGVSLLGGAQKGARAVNLVNASGSTVANGVNIARTPVSFNTINLNQTNTIVQRY
jgi:hypothetical protein